MRLTLPRVGEGNTKGEDVAEFKIPDAQLSDIVGMAIMQTLTADTRETLIKEAIRHLLAPKEGGGYGNRTSPLQDAFNCAIRLRAEAVIMEQVSGDTEVGQRIKALVAEVVERAMVGEGREKLVSSMVEAFAQGFKIREY